MKILALETSAKAVSAAVSENGRILAAGYQDTGLTHSRTLMPIVEHILKNTDLKLSDMDAIAVAVGPGSFTGIRIGVSAAKGLAFSVDKPAAVGVSTLAAMARNVAFSDGLIVCAMDARRSQVYNANFSAENGVLTRLTPDRAVSLDELAEEIRNDPRPITLVGDGAHLAYARFTEQGIPCRMAPPHLIMQNAMSVALEAEALAAQGKLASDIGDLVRIGHHTRGAAGKNGSSELPRSEQRGLDMHMGVHEAGNKIFPSAVEDSPGVYGLCLPAAQHSSDSAAVDDNGGAGNHLTVHDVNHFRVCERETAFPSAQSGVYAPLQIFKSYSRHAKPPGGLSSDSYIPSHESCKDTALPRRAGVTFLPFSGICRLHALHHT